MLVLLLLLIVLVLLLLPIVLLLLLVLVVVVGGGVGVGVAAAAAQLIFAFLWAPKDRQIGCVFAFFDTLEAKKHYEYRCFLRFGRPKPRYLRCFLPLVAKITVFTVFLSPRLAKTLLFTQFSPCCKM